MLIQIFQIQGHSIFGVPSPPQKNEINFIRFFLGKTQNWALNVAKNQQIIYTSINKSNEQNQSTDIKIL